MDFRFESASGRKPWIILCTFGYGFSYNDGMVTGKMVDGKFATWPKWVILYYGEATIKIWFLMVKEKCIIKMHCFILLDFIVYIIFSVIQWRGHGSY
jgi:hypothetical protein